MKSKKTNSITKGLYTISIILAILFAKHVIAQEPDNSQTFICTLDEQRFQFDLATDQVFLKTDSPYTKSQLRTFLPFPQLDFDLTDSKKGSMNIVNLSGTLTSEEVISLIKDLNSNDRIVFAAPLLINGSNRVAMSDQIIVKLLPGSSVDQLNQLCTNQGINNDGILPRLSGHYYSLRLSKDQIMDQLDIITDIKQADMFQFAEPNFIRFLNFNTFNDPHYGSQYALSSINAGNGWAQMSTAIQGGSAGIKVAVLDCGVQKSHPDLSSNIFGGFDATYFPPLGSTSSAGQTWTNTLGDILNSDAISYHGTTCAGVIAAKANNSTGIVGLAYNCKIVPVRIAVNLNSNTWISDDYIISSGISYAKGISDILSLSWGGGLRSSLITQEISSAVTTGRGAKGCPVFCAAGNSSSILLPYPAYLSDVIAVGATDANDQKASFSNYSVDLDISAPGDAVITTDLTGADGADPGDYATLNGTSLSAPYAAGLMALILSVNPSLNYATARNIIESTCAEAGGYGYVNNNFHPSKNWSNNLGYGRIDALASINMAQSISGTSSAGPLTVTLTSPTLNCYDGGGVSAYFNLKITGGSPYVNQWNPQTQTGYKYFLVDYWASSAGKQGSPSPHRSFTDNYYTQSTNAAAPVSGIKKIYLTFPSATVFPATVTIYVDVYGGPPNGVTHSLFPITVTVERSPDFTLSSISVCSNATVSTVNLVNTTIAGAHSWNLGNFPTNNINLSNPDFPVISGVTAANTIYLTQTAANGCAVTKASNISVSAITVPSISVVKKCLTTSPYTFTIGPPANPTGGIGAYTYMWYTNTSGALSNVTSRNPTVNTAIAGVGSKNYLLKVTDGIGCNKYFTYPVDLESNPNVFSLTSDLNNVCPGKPVTITSHLHWPYTRTYSNWTFSDPTAIGYGVIGIYPNPDIFEYPVQPMTTTTYTATVQDDYGCVLQASITINVSTSYPLVANAGPDITACKSPLKTITGTATGGVAPYTYKWKPGNQSSQTISVPNLTQEDTLIVTDSNGCKAIDIVQVTASVLYPQGLFNNLIHYYNGGVALSPSNTQFSPAGGGLPPYTYHWDPGQYFTNPNVQFPTTVPLTQSVFFTSTVSDANGCSVSNECNMVVVADERAPLQIYPETDACNGYTITGITHTGGIGAVGPGVVIGGPVYGDYVGDPNKPQCGTYFQQATNTYVFNPAPIPGTQNGSNAAFSSGPVNVTIIQTLNLPTPGSGANLTHTYGPFTVNFPPKDNSRNNLVVMPDNTIMYVGTDQLIHNSSIVFPIGGWGNIRVEGWLTVDVTGTYLYFKGTDQKLHYLYRMGSQWLLLTPIIPISVSVEGGLVVRPEGVYFIGTDAHIHRYLLAGGYQLVVPTVGNAWAQGHLVSGPNSTSNLGYWDMSGIVTYLKPTAGGWVKTNLSATPCSGELLMDQAENIFFKNMSGKIEYYSWQSGSYAYNGVINPVNDPNYNVDGFMVKDPYDQRIFYKGYDNIVYNLCYNSGTWYNWALNYSMNTVAGDLKIRPTSPNFEVVCIDAGKRIRKFYVFKTSGWLHSGSGGPVKACSNQYYKTSGSANCTTLDVSASSLKVCYGYNGQLSIYLPSGENPASYNLEIYESTNNSIVYSGLPNIVKQVSPSATTMYSFVLTNTITGCSQTSFHQIEVEELPMFTTTGSSESVCNGTTAYLKTNLPEGEQSDNYSLKIYKGLDELIYEGVLIETYPVTSSSTASYSLHVTKAGGCSNILSTDIVITNQGPGVNLNGSSEVVLRGQKAFISIDVDLSENAEEYDVTVFGNDLSVPVYQGTSSRIIETYPEENTNYHIIVKNTATGCITNVSWDIMVTDDPGEFLRGHGNINTIVSEDLKRHQSAENIPNWIDDDLLVYPNPSIGLFNVYAEYNESGTIQIYNMLGSQVQNIPLQASKTNYTVNLSGSAKGVYLLKVVSRTRNITRTLVLE